MSLATDANAASTLADKAHLVEHLDTFDNVDE